MNLKLKSTTSLAMALSLLGSAAFAGMEEATAFLDSEIGDLSSLSRADQEAEMQWFIDAAAPMAGMEIKVVSETITTHEYESQVLAPAFTAITGIKVTHDLIGEGDVVEKLQTQMQSGENIYDGYINDSDLIGTHWRYQQARNLTDWMAGEGADVTNPGLDLDDFIGTQFTTAPDGKLYQLPEHTFVGYFIGSPGMNVIPAEVNGATARIEGTELRLKRGYGDLSGKVELGVRPEFARLSRTEGLPVTVRRVEDVGRHKLVRAEVFGHDINIIADEDDDVSADMTHVVFDTDFVNVYANDWRVPGEAA